MVRFFALVLASMACGVAGCSSRPMVQDSALVSEISCTQIARETGLTLRQGEAGRILLEEGDRVVAVLSPGMTVVQLRGRYVPLDGVARRRGGTLWVPRSFLDRLLAGPSRRAAGPATARPASWAPGKSATPRRSGLVVLDAGHGGRDPGTRWGNFAEKAITLRVSLALARRLAGMGIRAVLTRSEDRYVGLDRRIDTANRLGADLFVSLHVNSCNDRRVSGIETIYKSRWHRSGDAELVRHSYRLASLLQTGLKSAVESRDRGVKRNDREIRVLRKARVPAVLVELGFLSHRREGVLLRGADYQRRLVASLARSIGLYLETRR